MENLARQEQHREMKFTIFGERCSGTNWLGYTLVSNFELELVWSAGFKHWFGYNGHEKIIFDNRDLIYFGIVRNPLDYLMSFYKKKHNQPKERTCDIETFLLSEFYSVNLNKNSIDYNEEISEGGVLVDRKHDGSRYKNIFEMRSEKCRFLLEKMPDLVSKYILIRYEDLKQEPERILNIILDSFKLSRKSKSFYVEKKYVFYKEKGVVNLSDNPCMENYKVDNRIKEIIIENLDKEVEQKMGYMSWA